MPTRFGLQVSPLSPVSNVETIFEGIVCFSPDFCLQYLDDLGVNSLSPHLSLQYWDYSDPARLSHWSLKLHHDD